MRIPPRNWFRNRLASVLLVLGALLATSAAPAADPPPAQPAQAAQQVRVSTNMGDFVIELMPDRAPLTVANFVRYVKEGYYSGTLIHRVVANFVIQGGGHSASDLKLKPVHDPVNNESGSGLQNKRGTVGLARGESAHSGNAQFYVNLVDNPDLDPLPTRWGYAVFGKIVQGMDVVDRIGVTPTGSSGPFKSDTPLKPVIINKVELLDGAGQATTAAPAPMPTPLAPPSQDAILSPK
ncbi:MAG TPA: peptidylprolyl isomerase [Steroidobacteraceae bacterium]|jgi:cyclophilin family peptidyl-prolyl cis-trans isomerase